MLVLTRQPKDTITIDQEIQIKILSVRGNRVQLGISAPASVQIVREELIGSGRHSELVYADQSAFGSRSRRSSKLPVIRRTSSEKERARAG